MTKLRLAIVGAGPAGIYAADILLKQEHAFDISIDLFDQLPAPYGLVRYGVAPDHPRIKGIITALHQVLDKPQIRLFGNIDYPNDLNLDDLRQFYDAVMRDPRVAATRVPPLDDIFEGESVIFVAQRVCGKKTGGKWGLYDLLGDYLSGEPLAGVDFPVSW